MSFNYPSFLWALAALAIPIIIHLFNFRKTTKVYFSSIRFLKQVKQETTQRRKLKQYLVLASRLLFIFFLVMVFAQPFLPATEQTTSQRSINIYLDNSYSMSAPVEDKMRALDIGINFVNEIVALFPPETKFKLLTNDFAPFSNSYKTGSEIIDQLSQIRLSPVSRTFAEVNNRLTEERATTFWISDFQKSTMGEPTAIDTANQFRLVPVQFNTRSNVFVDSVSLENPFIIGGEKNTIRVKLRNDGNRTVDGLILKLTINAIQAATSSITIQPNSVAETSFDIAETLQGYNQAQLSFSDFPISFDNDFYFSMNYTGKLRIIEVKAGRGQSYIEKVLGNKQLFDLTSAEASNLDYALLNQADLVILNGIDRIDAALSAALQQYQQQGGSLLLISGIQPDVSSYQPFVSAAITRVETKDMVPLDQPDYSNPFFENVFEERARALAMPKARRLLSWGNDRSAILKFNDGQPFLSHLANTFVLASPLQKDYTDLFNHALFVPIMYRIASTSKRLERKPYFSLTSSTITVQADSLQGEEPARLTGAQEIIPSQRRMGNKLVMELPRFSVNPGFYYAMHKKDTLDLLAFNLDKKESRLEQFTGEQMKEWMGGGEHISIFEANSTQAFSNEIKARYLGTPLWKYALILALLFLLVEVLLIRFLK